MNKMQLKGSWNEFKGKVKEKWGKLTDDDLKEVEGNYDQLVGKLQQRYGYEKEKAEEELGNFSKDCGHCGH